MSIEIYVDCFENGERKPIPIQIVETAFGRYADRTNPRLWELCFPDSIGTCRLNVDDTPTVAGFAISRPVDSALLFDALYAVLMQCAGVIYWPGGCVIGDEGVLRQLPPDMVEALGPKVVRSGEEMGRHLAKSG